MTFAGAVGAGTYRPTFTINAQSSGISLYANGGYQASLPGMLITGDGVNGYTVAGSTGFAMNIPMVFGTAIDVSFQMWVATLPRANVGLLTASSARLTGIRVFDAAGNLIDNFSITAGSGTLYGPGDVIAVPEPGSWLLTLAGLLVVGWRKRWDSNPRTVARRRFSRPVP
jgi:PEP-CTERM motif